MPCVVLGIGLKAISFGAILARLAQATFVAVVTLGEPVGSAAMAFVFFGEGFAPTQFGGFALLLAGIYMAVRRERG